MSKPNPSDATEFEATAPGDGAAARLAANRANAQHSTGPRTPAGKARSSLNALKHGCFSRHLERAAGALGEDRAEFDALLAGLTAEYAPEGPEETLLVDRMAALWWRMQRLAAQQQAYLAERLKGAIPLAALEESEASSLLEARLDRMLRAARKDLLARQAWRSGAAERRVAALRRQADAEVAERALAIEAREWHAMQERIAQARARRDAEGAAAGEAASENAPREGNGVLPGLGVPPRAGVGSTG
jgi:hypothetical protein